jgi:hypothetical protein
MLRLPLQSEKQRERLAISAGAGCTPTLSEPGSVLRRALWRQPDHNDPLRLGARAYAASCVVIETGMLCHLGAVDTIRNCLAGGSVLAAH